MAEDMRFVHCINDYLYNIIMSDISYGYGFLLEYQSSVCCPITLISATLEYIM